MAVVRHPALPFALLLSLVVSIPAGAIAQPAQGSPDVRTPAASAAPVGKPPTIVGPKTVVPTDVPITRTANEPPAITDGAALRAVDVRPMHELSPWSMFLAADSIVKAVMIGLLIASLMTWTIFVAKTIELALARRRLTKALSRLAGATSMTEAKLAVGSREGVLQVFLAAAVGELEASPQTWSDSGIKERGDSRLLDLVRAEMQSTRRGMGILATVGSTAPFVGLFGTVWGIMNSFIGISKAQTTNLAVVAPGIAEALLATAVGLFAAIPAVIIYNHFSRATRSYQLLVNRAASASGRLLSRELDRRRGGMSNRAAI